MNKHIDLSDLDIDELETRLELAAGDPTGTGTGDPTTDGVTVGVGYGWSF
jgi:hypothetical protein